MLTHLTSANINKINHVRELTDRTNITVRLDLNLLLRDVVIIISKGNEIRGGRILVFKHHTTRPFTRVINATANALTAWYNIMFIVNFVLTCRKEQRLEAIARISAMLLTASKSILAIAFIAVY